MKMGRPQPGGNIYLAAALFEQHGRDWKAQLERQTAVKSLIPWVGGKKALAKTLVPLLPKHHCYVEVFGGAAWVLFGKQPSRQEIYNDVDGRLVGLFRTVKEHPDEFVRQLELVPNSREVFDLYISQPGLTEIQRAARFYYVLKLAFGAKVTGRPTLGTGPTRGKRLLMAHVIADVDAVHERIERAIVERLDCEALLRKYDRPDTCFFVDPPYVAAEDVYRERFTREDHERLRATLAELQGKWLLTYGDHPWVRAAYSGCHAWRVEAPYTLSAKTVKTGGQLVIANYRPTAAQLRAAARDLVALNRRRSRKK